MMMFELKNNFDSMTPLELYGKGTYVFTCLTGNVPLANVSPTAVELGAVVKIFKTDSDAAATGDRLAIARRDQSAKVVSDTMKKMTVSVMALASNDKVILMSSGFDLVKTRAPKPPIVNPAPPKLRSTGTPGEISSVGKRQPAQVSVKHEITEAPLTDDSVWRSETDSSVKHTFTGLQPGREYMVRLCIVGPYKQCKASTPISFICQ